MYVDSGYGYGYGYGNAFLVRTTVGSEAEAQRMARKLLGPRLASCVHVHGIRSFYTWQGVAKDETEWVVEARVVGWMRRGRVIRAAREGHPYQQPLVETAMVTVNRSYRRWMKTV